MKDTVNSTQTKIRLFADATCLYILFDSLNSAAEQLNSDTEKINSWSKTWLAAFNPAETESMIFSRKRSSKPPHPDLFFDDVQITTVKDHSHHGVTLSDDAHWNTHISSSLQKAGQSIGILRPLKFKLNRSSLGRMYMSFIRPLLEYSDVAWDNCSQELKDKLEIVQNEAARCDSLSSRRRKYKLSLSLKMYNNLSPNYLSNHFHHFFKTNKATECWSHSLNSLMGPALIRLFSTINDTRLDSSIA